MRPVSLMQFPLLAPTGPSLAPHPLMRLRRRPLGLRFRRSTPAGCGPHLRYVAHVTGAISPPAPVADLSMPWDAAVEDPVAAIAAARAEHGDTFVVAGAGTQYLFLFSPAGVRSFYDLA